MVASCSVPSASTHTVSAAVPVIVALSARAAGADPSAILAGTGLDLSAPPAADDHVDAAVYFEVWRRAMRLVDDERFPLRAATTFQLEDHEVFGFLAMSCETLGQAYDRTVKYRALYCVGAKWELEVDDEVSRMVWHPWPGDPDDPGYRAAMSFAVADMEKAIRRLGRTSPRPLAVKLAHPAPTSPASFGEHFGVPPVFGSSGYELVYGRGLRELPVATFNSRLRDYFDDACRRLIGRYAEASTVGESVRRQLIAAMDGGDSSIEAVAKRMGMSPRSLQRRLSEEGVRYQDLLSDVRTELAKRYLARRSVSASEVADLLGFTEPPAFFKAFKRWTGMTPGEFQEAAAPAG